MKLAISRNRLLAGAALGFGLAMAPQQAQAACVVGAFGTVCDDTTTTDTLYPVNVPNDRAYEYGTVFGGTNTFLTVDPGATVDGFGLAFVDVSVGTGILDVTNGGVIQVDAGNTPTAGGGNAALFLTSVNSNINYTGAGDIFNLGTGDGLDVDITGTGSFTANIGGSVTSTTGEAISVDHSGTAGDVSITTTAGETILNADDGIAVFLTNAANTGSVTIVNNANIGGVTAGAMDDGIDVEHSGLGSVSVTNNGTIGSATDRAGAEAIDVSIINAASTAGITVDGSGDVFADSIGITATNAGAGTVVIDYSGAVDSLGSGVVASSSGGNIDVALGAVTAAGGVAVDIDQTDAAGSGAVLLTSNGDLAAATTAIDIDNAGTGSVTVDVLGSIDADAGDAINVSSTNTAAGAIDITTASGETLAVSGGDGIEVDTAGTGAVTVTNAANITSGAGGAGTFLEGIDVDSTGTGNVTIVNTGNIGTALDAAAEDGIDVNISNAASAGNISVTGSGAIFADDEGIEVETAGTGTVTVNYAGAITSGFGEAIEATSTTGALSVTTGAGAITSTDDDAIDTETTTGTTTIVTGAGAVTGNVDGINATSTSGAIDVTVGGVLTGTTESGIETNTTGMTTVTVGADGDVTGGTEAILIAGTGDADISNAGIIGAAATDLAVNAAAGGVVTLTNETSGTLSGTILLGGADDTVTNSGEWNTEGVNDFGAGADLLTNTASGTINIGPATSFLGLETMDNVGTINAATGFTFDGGNTVLTNTGDINAAGTIDFGAGTDDFANDAGGFFNLTGDTTLAGLETFSNDGTIDLGTYTLTGPAIAFVNTGTIDTDGDAAIAGFTTFDNDGLLDLGPGTLTVIVGQPFNNSGTIEADEGVSEITGQTVFNNSGLIDMADGAANDELTIDSDFVGSGDSTLAVDFTGSTSDLLIINGDASGETAVDATYLGGGLNLDGVLVVDAVTSDDDAFVLGTVSGETPLVFVDLVQDGADYYLITAPTAAAFNPLVVPGFAMDLWYQSADEVFAETVKPATTTGFSFWGNGYVSRDRYGDKDDSVTIDGITFDVDNRVRTKRHGVQVGADYGFGGGRVGLTGGYAWADANGSEGANPRARGWNVGVYGQFGGLTGFHGEFLVKHDRYDAEFEDGAFEGVDFDIRSTGFDGSLGYRFGFGGATMDIHGGLSHVRTKVDDIGAFGFDYDIAKVTSTRGRAGVRAILGGSLAPYVDASVYREFDGDGDVELFDGLDSYDLDTRGKGTWFRVEAGLSGNNGPGPILAAWGDFGDRKGLGLRAGWRFGGGQRIVEAAPPPPPPPPPPAPAPATQTCPDGSVILATDMCPPPPPPPPPPPMPERG